MLTPFFFSAMISNCFETKLPEQLLIIRNLIPCILISAMFFFSSQIFKQKASSLAKSLKSNTSLSLEGLDTRNKRRWDFQGTYDSYFHFHLYFYKANHVSLDLLCQYATHPSRTIIWLITTVPFLNLESSSCFFSLDGVSPLLSLPDGLTAVRKLTADIRASVCSRRFSDEKVTCGKHESPWDQTVP